MRKIQKLLIFILIGCAFIYGLLAGHYHLFPFSQILTLKNKAVSIVRVDSEEEPSLENTAKEVEILETALQRLLLKKISLTRDESNGRGGAIANSGNKVFVNVNSDSLDKELILVYDFEKILQYETDSLRVPTNYERLLSSSIAKMDDFDLFRYRVSGLYAEEDNDGAYKLFASHNYFEEDQNCISFNLSRTKISFEDNTLNQESEWDTIFKATPCVYPDQNVDYKKSFPGQMAAGQIIPYDDKTLMLSVGTFSTDPDLYPSLPMDDSSSFGKILLIDKESGDSTVFAKGLRNSQGLTIASDGTIWATDQGPRGGDELNIINKEGNYGWPKETYGINYGIEEWPISDNQGRHDRYDKPAFVWIPSIAPTGIVQLQGDKYPLWNGDFLVGSLAARTLNRVRVQDNHTVMYNESIQLDNRIRDLITLPDEKILILTDDGSLLIIDDGGPVYDEIDSEIEQRMITLDLYNLIATDLNRPGQTEEALSAETIFAHNCSACHMLSQTNSIGPHLNNLFEREVGGLSDFNYSHSLEESNEQWTPELLRSFLLEPQSEFPNINMVEVPLVSSEADSIITLLQQKK